MYIVLCDANEQESAYYAGICRRICDGKEMPAEIKTYIRSSDFLFDMDDDAFSYLVSILIIEPENGFESTADTVRRGGYDGLILYLSHSASFDRCLQAFDAGAANYILKGADQKRLQRFYNVFNKTLKEAVQFERQYLVLSCAGDYRQVNIKDIHYFEAAMDHMIKVAYNDVSFKFVSTLQSLEERLCDRGFIRVHRSYLVALDAIHALAPGELILNNGYKVPVSRNQALVRSALSDRKL